MEGNTGGKIASSIDGNIQIDYVNNRLIITNSSGVEQFFAGIGEYGLPRVFFGDSLKNNINWNGHILDIKGTITAENGTIGGWIIGLTSLSDTTGSVGMSSDETVGDDVRFWAGDTEPTLAPFQVTKSGNLIATNADISGSITATLGFIGGFTIGETDLTASADGNTTILSSGEIVLSAGPTGSPTFEIRQDGSLTATSAVITGEITTESGSILGGQYIVNSSVDYAALDVASFLSLSAITANMGAITSGTITLDSAGHLKGGQTDFDTGTGLYLGYSGGDYKFSVGSSVNSLLWDGVALTIKGKITTTAPINVKAYTTATLPTAGVDTAAKPPSANTGTGAGLDQSFTTTSDSVDTMEYVGAGDGFTNKWGQSFTIATTGSLYRIDKYIDSAWVSMYLNNIPVTAATKYWTYLLYDGSTGTTKASLYSDDSNKPGSVLSPLYTSNTYATQKSFASGSVIKGATAGGLANGEFGIGTATGTWGNGSKDAAIRVYTISPFTNPANVYGAGYATCATDSGVVSLQISKDGGTNWSTAKSLTLITGAGDTTLTYGSTTDTWGIPLSGADINSTTNFKVRIKCGTNVLFQQDYNNFGFAEAAGDTIIGLKAVVVAKYVAGTPLLSIDSLTVTATVSDSDSNIVEGSIAYDSTLNTITANNGSTWDPMVNISGTQTLLNKTFTSAKITTNLSPTSNNGAALGSTSLQFSDLFLAEGGVINWDNGDATLTQVGNVVTLAGADLKVTTPGTASTSVATIDGTQTLTNKTMTTAGNTLTNSYMFSATRITTNQTSIADSTYTTVVFNSEAFDPGADFNTATGLYTVPVTGYYQFNTMIRATATSLTAFAVRFYGSTSLVLAKTYKATSGEEVITLSDLCYVVAGETVAVQVYIDGTGASGVVVADSYFSGYLVSK